MKRSANACLFFLQLEGFLVTLHDRGVVNEDRLLELFKNLLDGQPLRIDQLSAVFGPEAIYEMLQAEHFL